jgi:hypothetical protein
MANPAPCILNTHQLIHVCTPSSPPLPPLFLPHPRPTPPTSPPPQGLWPDAQASLQRVLYEVSASLEKLGSREAGLNTTFGGQLGRYRGAREQLVAAQQEYNRWGGGVGGKQYKAGGLCRRT